MAFSMVIGPDLLCQMYYSKEYHSDPCPGRPVHFYPCRAELRGFIKNQVLAVDV